MITLSDVGKRFESRVILRGINLHVPAGSLAILMGSNGCGKTTLLNIMAGIDAPSTGKLTRECASDKIVHLGVSPSIYPHLTAYENLKFWEEVYGGNPTTDQIKDVLDIVGLAKYADTHVRIFSTGMKKRLHIARAHIRLPKLLLMDETSDGLDKSGIEILIDEIERAKTRGAAVILVTHSMDFERYRPDMILSIEGRSIVRKSFGKES